MELQRRITNKPPHYAKIPLYVHSPFIEKRQELVRMVLEKSYSIAKASRKLNIKSSSAKLIIKRYKEEGTFFQKRSERLARIKETRKEISSYTPPVNFFPKTTTQISYEPVEYYEMPTMQPKIYEAIPFFYGNTTHPSPYSYLYFPNVGIMTPPASFFC